MGKYQSGLKRLNALPTLVFESRVIEKTRKLSKATVARRILNTVKI
jgi:hypothetical protein